MFAVLSYLWHWLNAVNEHSLQSPFLYNLYTQTIAKKRVYEDFNAIEQYRQQLIDSKVTITVVNLGADSRVNNKSQRAISAIAKKGISSAKISRLLNNIIKDFNCKVSLELGTAFGINTMYMATNPSWQVCSFEGSPEIAEVAKSGFKQLGYTNIQLIEGNIDHTLAEFSRKSESKIDLAFIDANHRYEPTISYFEQLIKICHKQSIIVIDDIYWSSEMAQAWKAIKLHPLVTTTVDLYKVGIVFLRPELEKQHIRLLY